MSGGSEKRSKLRQCKLALLTLVFPLLAAGAIVFFGLLTSDLIHYPGLDGRARGEVVAQSGGKGCSSTVDFTVRERTYRTDYGGCPGYGQPVQVRYDEEDPARATADGPMRAYVGYPLMMLMALLGAGLFGLLSYTHWELLRGREPVAKLSRSR